MGIASCGDEYSVTGETSGMIYLISGVVYLFCEVIYMWKTVQIYRQQREMRLSWELMVFYGSLHLAFIRSTLFFFGGTLICFPIPLYNVIETYCFVFKKIAFFVLVYRMVKIMQAGMGAPDVKHWASTLLLGACCLDLCVYTLLFILMECKVGIPGTGLYIDVVLVDFGLTLIFIIYARKFAAIVRQEAYHAFRWNIFTLIMIVAFILRVCQGFYYLFYSHQINTGYKKSPLYALHNVLYSAGTELAPCFIMILVVASGMSKSADDNVSTHSSGYND
jgi:hypothetical protein